MNGRIALDSFCCGCSFSSFDSYCRNCPYTEFDDPLLREIELRNSRKSLKDKEENK